LCGSVISRQASQAAQRYVESGRVEQLHAVALQLVGHGDSAVGAYGLGQRGHGHGGQLQREEAAAFDQGARARGLVEHDGNLGRREIKRAGPGGGHGVALARVLGRDQHGGAVVEQAVGLVQRDGGAVFGHGKPVTGG